MLASQLIACKKQEDGLVLVDGTGLDNCRLIRANSTDAFTTLSARSHRPAFVR